MLVLLMLAVGVGLLVHGVAADQPVEVYVAGGLGLAALVLSYPWQRAEDEPPGSMEPEPEPANEMSAPEDAPERVVFVAGRTTFHAPACTAVSGRAVSHAERGELERGGMTACRRCLPE